MSICSIAVRLIGATPSAVRSAHVRPLIAICCMALSLLSGCQPSATSSDERYSALERIPAGDVGFDSSAISGETVSDPAFTESATGSSIDSDPAALPENSPRTVRQRARRVVGVDTDTESASTAEVAQETEGTDENSEIAADPTGAAPSTSTPGPAASGNANSPNLVDPPAADATGFPTSATSPKAGASGQTALVLDAALLTAADNRLADESTGLIRTVADTQLALNRREGFRRIFRQDIRPQPPATNPAGTRPAPGQAGGPAVAPAKSAETSSAPPPAPPTELELPDNPVAPQQQPAAATATATSTVAEDSEPDAATRSGANGQPPLYRGPATGPAATGTLSPPVSAIDSAGPVIAALPVSRAIPTGEAKGKPKPPACLKWPQPKLGLLLSGDQNGYLEPCGCSLTQSGGVARRADLLQRLQAAGWTMAGIDHGNTLRRARKQDTLRFEAILNALEQMRYVALGLGPAELRLSADYLLTLTGRELPASKLPLAFVSANVTLFDTPEIGVPQRYQVVTVGGVKLGITGVIANSAINSVAPGGRVDNIAISDPTRSLDAALQALRAQKPELLIVLSYGTVEEARQWAKLHPDVDLILTSGGPEDPDPTPERIGKTLIILPGQKGKNVGVLGYYPEARGNDRLRFDLVDLDNRQFQSVKAMEQIMIDYQDRLKSEQLWLSRDLIIRHPSGAKFVGAANCGECHKKAYEIWKDSGHARGFVSINEGREGHEDRLLVPRIYDPECLCCHVVGWEPQQVLRFDSGYRDEKSSQHLLGNQCENCHGPGSVHSAVEARYAAGEQALADQVQQARKAVRVTLEQAKKKTCYECHDADNSPSFKFDEYWESIVHPERD